jgi:hypothetical protein
MICSEVNMSKTLLFVVATSFVGFIGLQAWPQDPGPHGGVSTLTGCITSGRTEDTYTLANNKTKKDVTLFGPDKIKSQIGHQVKVTGTWEGEAAGSTGSSSAASDHRMFKVEKIIMLSDTCSPSDGKSR